MPNIIIVIIITPYSMNYLDEQIVSFHKNKIKITTADAAEDSDSPFSTYLQYVKFTVGIIFLQNQIKINI